MCDYRIHPHLAVDVGRYKFTVNAICPGCQLECSLELYQDWAKYKGRPFDPEAFRKRIQEFQNNPKRVSAGCWAADEGYQGKGSSSEDTAALAAFLASDDAATMTGQDINTDGSMIW